MQPKKAIVFAAALLRSPQNLLQTPRLSHTKTAQPIVCKSANSSAAASALGTDKFAILQVAAITNDRKTKTASPSSQISTVTTAAAVSSEQQASHINGIKTSRLRVMHAGGFRQSKWDEPP